MLLLIDNYDSFTYNLYQYLCELGSEVKVVRNNKMTVDEIGRWIRSGSSSRRDRRIPVKPVFPTRLSGILVTACRCSESALGTSASDTAMEGPWGVRRRSCTANHP